jgi:hypothetical protein
MNRAASVAVIALLACASSAHAAWYPVFRPSFVQLRPGETATLTVHGAWLSGISYFPFSPMTFTTTDPAVAVIEGNLPTTHETPVQITAGQPGVARVLVVEYGGRSPFPTTPVIVVAEQELPVAIEAEGAPVVKQEITLRAVSDEPEAEFTWYTGPLNGLYTWMAGTGPELTVVPEAPLVYEYWVLMTSPRGAGTATIALVIHEQPTGRRRAIRH